jgi:hypothetical protein
MNELAKINVNGKEYLLKDETARQGSGGNVELDTTLVQSGKAADAKAVGDAINGLRSYIDDEILGGAW